MKFTMEGSVKVKFKLIYPFVSISIKDTGIGMEDKIRNSLF